MVRQPDWQAYRRAYTLGAPCADCGELVAWFNEENFDRLWESGLGRMIYVTSCRSVVCRGRCMQEHRDRCDDCRLIERARADGVCWHFLKQGRCRFGACCKFQHPDAELPEDDVDSSVGGNLIERRLDHEIVEQGNGADVSLCSECRSTRTSDPCRICRELVCVALRCVFQHEARHQMDDWFEME